MTAKAALIKHLLSGDVINIKTCFNLIGLTNCPREISRMVEQPFNVVVSRTRMEGQSRYGQAVSWIDYRLNKSDHNLEGIKKMVEYLLKEGAVEKAGAKTEYTKPTTTTVSAADFANSIINQSKQQELF